jgi:hypothetical protein
VLLRELGQRFDAFRGENRRFTRVPGELRAAAVAALREGVTPSGLRRVCGISTSQLASWRSERPSLAAAAAEVPSARAFRVIDDAPASGGGAAAVIDDDALELRLGPWSVLVRVSAEQGLGRARGAR